MKRLFNILTIVLVAAWAAAQNPHSYNCDFEDAAENAQWHLNTPKNENYTWVNQWVIGNAVASLGKQSLYISPDGGKTAAYKKTESRIMVAWRELTLEAGRYDLAFDWMCGGDSARAAILVAWVPESDFYRVVNGESLPNIQCMLNDEYKSREWLANNMLQFNERKGLLTGGSVWTHAVDTLVTDGTPHRLVFMFLYSSSAQLVQPGPCVDNIQLSRNNCGAPTNMSVSKMSMTAKMEWTSSGESFNLRMHRMGETSTQNYTDIRNTNYSVTLEEGVYDIQIQVVCEGDTSVWYNFPMAIMYDTKCFDYLDLTDERCLFSWETAADYHDNTPLLKPGRIDYGFTSMASRHTIHYHPEEYDARTVGSVDASGNPVPPLKTVPEGALASVRVGSWEGTARVARVEYDFVVDASEASVLMLQYAMVLESSGHTEEQRPRMTIDIVDANTGKALSKCTTVDLAAQTSGEGWNRVPIPATPVGSRDVCWRDWTTLGLNMADYDGLHVKVQITTYGCTAEVHYGYAYFVLTCTSGQIKGMHCGWEPTNEFIAPEGFNYRWYKVTMPSETLGRNNVYKVDYKDTCTYAVDMTYKSNKDCGFTLYANATPRFPIPEATYKLEQRDCGNYITFTNTSHIRTHNWKTGEDVDTPLRPEYIGWSFDGLSPVFDTPEALWNPSFRLPDEEADYHFLLYAGVGLCDSVQKLNIHVPAVGPDSVVDKVQRCAGDIYYHYGKPYTKDTLIKDRDYNMAGCDSLHVTDLRFVDAIHDTIDATITDQESYIFNGQTLTSSGEYSAGPFVSIAGCDSMVLLRLTVVVTLAMELTAVEQPCYGATSFLIETHARRGLPNHYSLTYDEVGTTAGLKPQSGDLIDGNDNTLIIPIPPEVKPGYYPFTILFGSKENGTDKQTSELVLHYPASLICQRWDDVLGILNAEHNGGYDFQYFQWYRNGEPIDGATQPYYYLESKLQPGDIYTVELKENADERGLTTCGYIVHATAATPVAAPQRLLRGGQLYITVNGRTYNALGGIVE